MASLIRTNLLSNERLDLTDFNNIENFVIEDFNAVMKFLMTGSSYVVSGFRLYQDSAALVDNPTSSPIYVKLAGSSAIHSESNGTPFYYVGASSLDAARIDLIPNSTNYLEMELSITTGSPDTRAFWDPSANNGEGAEFTQIIDIARNLTANFSVNTTGFTGGNKLPIAEIVLSGGAITNVYDRRNLFFRLGKGSPEDATNNYPWVQGRIEPDSDRSTDPDAFTGADKSISTFKELIDALLTKIKELSGTDYWFEIAGSSVIGLMRNMGLSIPVAMSANARFAWDGNNLEITDDNVSPVGTDVIAAIRSFDTTANLNLTRETIALADGEILYVEFPVPIASATYDGVGAGALNYKVAARGSVPNEDKVFWIAYREGTKCYLRYFGDLEPGEEIEISDNVNENILAAIGLATETSMPNYTSNIRGVIAESLVARTSALTDAIGDEQEDRSAYFRSNNPVTWTGTQLEFTTDIIFEVLNTKSSVIKRATIQTAQSPIVLNNLEMAYVVIDRTVASENVTVQIASVLPAQLQSTKDLIVLAYRIDVAGEGFLHLPFHKQVLEVGQTVRLGASGAGSGGIKATLYDPISISLPTGSNSTVVEINQTLGGLDYEIGPTAGRTQIGQGFVAVTTDTLYSISVRLRNLTGATGNLVLKLYEANTNDSLPDLGALLATSSPINVSTITGSYANYEFILTSAFEQIAAGTYTWILDSTLVNDDIEVEANNTNTLPGNDQIAIQYNGSYSQIGVATDLRFSTNLLTSGIIIDGEVLHNKDQVLFANLTTNNNRIYEASNVETSVVWTPVRAFGGQFDARDADSVRIQKGEAFQESLPVFNGTTFLVNDTVRFFDGVSANFWELSSIKESPIANNTTDTIFSVTAFGSENMIVSFSILRGGIKETGDLYLTHENTNASCAVSSTYTGITGVIFDAVINGSNLELNYTSDNTGSSGTIKYFVKRWSDLAGGPTGIPSYSSTGGGGGGGNAAGNPQEIQYNNAGVLAGDSRFKIDAANNALNLNGLNINTLSSGITMLDNQASPLTVISYAAATYKFAIVEYSVERGVETRVGRLLVTNNGTITSLHDDWTETTLLGIDFSAGINAGNVEIRYTSSATGQTGTFKYSVRRWN